MPTCSQDPRGATTIMGLSIVCSTHCQLSSSYSGPTGSSMQSVGATVLARLVTQVCVCVLLAAMEQSL